MRSCACVCVAGGPRHWPPWQACCRCISMSTDPPPASALLLGGSYIGAGRGLPGWLAGFLPWAHTLAGFLPWAHTLVSFPALMLRLTVSTSIQHQDHQLSLRMRREQSSSVRGDWLALFRRLPEVRCNLDGLGFRGGGARREAAGRRTAGGRRGRGAGPGGGRGERRPPPAGGVRR